MENVTGYTKVDIAGIKGTTVDSNTLYIKDEDLKNAKSFTDDFTIYEKHLCPCDADTYFVDSAMKVRGGRLSVYCDGVKTSLKDYLMKECPYVTMTHKDVSGDNITLYLMKVSIENMMEAHTDTEMSTEELNAYSFAPDYSSEPTHIVKFHMCYGCITGAEAFTIDEERVPETVLVMYKHIDSGMLDWLTGYVLKKDLDEIFETGGLYTDDMINDMTVKVFKNANAKDKIGKYKIKNLKIDLGYRIRHVLDFSNSVRRKLNGRQKDR